ncbi:hypothetical protein IFR05_005578 [Cadophora sp. M221]|nr:hypothetical protein IFR05_005578 [Cadophora sp. M221]
MSTNPNTLARLSDAFVISCGTITLDPAQAKMLLIRWKTNGEVFLPKGRKNIGEVPEDAAVRDLWRDRRARATAKLDCGLSTEPVAFSQRTMLDGTLKLIFWFAAQGDSTAVHDKGTQEEGEDFNPIWIDLGSAVDTLTFNEDKEIANRVIQLYNLPFHCKASVSPC